MLRSPDAVTPPALVVMGVAGAGKTTVGERIAAALGVTFLDADAFHPAENVAKMRSGVPLTDTDRAGWLQALRAELSARAARADGVVLACSALKAAYRGVLTDGNPGLRFVYLAISPEVAQARLAARPGHFMPPSLVVSQFDALEPPSDALLVDAMQPLELVVQRILSSL